MFRYISIYTNIPNIKLKLIKFDIFITSAMMPNINVNIKLDGNINEYTFNVSPNTLFSYMSNKENIK